MLDTEIRIKNCLKEVGVNVELTGEKLKPQTFSLILQNPGKGELLQLGLWEVGMEHESIIGRTE